jgi:hypothetical protein
MNPRKGEHMIDIVTNAKLKQVFGKKECTGWKPNVNDHSIAANCDALSKLYDVVYGHALDNGQFSTFFLKGWLAQCKVT